VRGTCIDVNEGRNFAVPRKRDVFGRRSFRRPKTPSLLCGRSSCQAEKGAGRKGFGARYRKDRLSRRAERDDRERDAREGIWQVRLTARGGVAVGCAFGTPDGFFSKMRSLTRGLTPAPVVKPNRSKEGGAPV